MKYEPEQKLNYNSSPIEILMMPFVEAKDLSPPDWELNDIVADCIRELSEADQEALYGIFYDRLTYEELTDTLGIKAKSHAWRRTQQALGRLKEKLLEHPTFQEKTDGKYKDNH